MDTRKVEKQAIQGTPHGGTAALCMKLTLMPRRLGQRLSIMLTLMSKKARSKAEYEANCDAKARSKAQYKASPDAKKSLSSKALQNTVKGA